jgi:squalene-hopene/tetraprenyl-beta-curcumene cyclase
MTPASKPRAARTAPSLEELVRGALDRALERLLEIQDAAGFWCGELEGDSILQSEYILLKFIHEQEDDERLPKIANYLRKQQRAEDGAWVQYPGASPDLSATVKAYFALKLLGDSPDAPHMRRARELILELGGAERSNTYSKFYLAALGQMPYASIPAIPPELILLPKWFYFHIDKISAWSRTMLLPLAVVATFQPVRRLTESQGIAELYLDAKYLRRSALEFDGMRASWKNLFLALDRGLKAWEKTGLTPLRRRALRRIEAWMLEHNDPRHSDGMGAIFPPMVYILIAFRCLGYDAKDPRVVASEQQLDRFMIEEGETIRLQPCFSSVWDTGIAAYALCDAGFDRSHAALEQAATWLLAKECRGVVGDWKANVRDVVEPTGWFFEFKNAYYPDVDDTAMVSMSLLRIGGRAELEAARRGASWLLAMQNDDGGWAAFDRTRDRPLLESVPFADHNAIQDPSCPDITGRTLECLGHHGFRPDHPAVARAVRFIVARHEPEGCWFGRWGVNYKYGTRQVVCGQKTVGVDMRLPWILRAGEWLRRVQHEDGSFGESADSYENPSRKGLGPATASQTAWGTMALEAVYGSHDPAVERGLEWLARSQQTDGTWEEQWFTGTGFPRVFYLRYHLYRLYFPVMCLGRWQTLGRRPLEPNRG